MLYAVGCGSGVFLLHVSLHRRMTQAEGASETCLSCGRGKAHIRTLKALAWCWLLATSHLPLAKASPMTKPDVQGMVKLNTNGKSNVKGWRGTTLSEGRKVNSWEEPCKCATFPISQRS